MPLSFSAQNLRVLPQIPSGPGHLFTPVCLNNPNTLPWSITALLSDIKDCLTSEMCDEKSCVSKRVKKLFMWFGNASSDTPSRLTLDPRGADALLTAAMFLIPCQAARRQPQLNFDSFFFLYFSFAFLSLSL